MSIYSNVSEQDLIISRELADQQKNQRALKTKNRILKQAHDIKLAESLSPITKKLDKVNESTKNLGEVNKESNSEIENNQEIVPVENGSEDENIRTNPRALTNSNKFSTLMTETLGTSMNSKISLKLTQDDLDRALILGTPIYTLGGDRIRINDIVYDLTPEKYKVLSSTSYTGKTMKNKNDILMMNNIKRDLGYTSVGDKSSERKTFSTKPLPKLVEEIPNKTFDEIVDSDDLQGEGLKINITSKINETTLN